MFESTTWPDKSFAAEFSALHVEISRAIFTTLIPPFSTYYKRAPFLVVRTLTINHSHGFTWPDGTDVGELLLLYDHVMNIGDEHHAMNAGYNGTYPGITGTFNGT